MQDDSTEGIANSRLYVSYYRENYNKTSLILIISGALGNLYDRISYGYVIDLIELHYDNFYWPIFNFADITISIGTMILLIYDFSI